MGVPMRPLLFLLSLLAIAAPAFADVPYQVVDLRTTPHVVPSSRPVFVTTVNGLALFTTYDDAVGTALWRTDGTPLGTERLLQLSGFNDISASQLRVGNTFYFGGSLNRDEAIWKTDGTVTGTSVVVTHDFLPLLPVGVLGERVLYTRGGRELLAIDAQGERLLATLRNPSASTRWTSRVQWRDHVYVANEHGLWKTDGTESGTTKLTTVQSWALTVAQDRLFFVGLAPGEGPELWTSDGTAAGTRAVSAFDSDLMFTVLSATLAPFGDGLLFFGYGGELGFSDGTAGGTRVIRTGRPLGRTAPRVAVLNGVAYFAFDDGEHGRVLWRSDGTDAGTYMVAGTSAGADAPLDALTASGSKLYYFGSDGEHAYALFESDGTASGTRLLHDLSAGWTGVAYTLAVLGDKILFRGWDAEHGHEPWVLDAAGARLLVSAAPEDPGSSDPEHLLAHGHELFFIADSEAGPALWRTDGSAAGTLPVRRAEYRDELPLPLVSFGGTLYLTRGAELRKFDASSGTDVLVKEFTDGKVEDAVVTGGQLFLRAENGSGVQLWTTDGTAAGTIPLTSFAEFGEEPMLPMSLAGRHHFLSTESRLYATNGAPEGVRLIAGAVTEHESAATPLVAFGPSLYFFSSARAQGDTSMVLRKLSGGAADATDLARFPYAVPSVAVTRDAIFFTFDSWSAPTQLWKSDGTPEGTKLVREFAVPTEDRRTTLVSLGDRVVFAADDGVHGLEPWVSDGTTEGTRLLRDISSGASEASEAFVADGLAYFAATDDLHGRELWQTDGTPEGTKLVADVAPGTASSSPGELTRVGDTLYFSARSTTGRELWAYPLPGDVVVTIDDARANESAGSIALTVRLTRASAQRVEVDYETADDTARAGRDYTAVRGTLTFAPGQTSRSVTIPILDDAAPGVTRGFFVRLKNANVRLGQTVAGGIIEDDDVAVDLVLSLVPHGHGARLRVENAGASSASNVVLCYATPPTRQSFQCTPAFALKAGEVRTQEVGEFGSGAIVANVTQWESDSTPSNNASTWSVASVFPYVLYVHPAEPRVGESVTLTVTASGTSDVPRDVRLISSYSRIITLPPSITIPANADSASIQAPTLQSGVVILAIEQPTQAHGVTVFVYDPATPLKATPILRWAHGHESTWGFGPVELTLNVSGLTTSGMRPTGTVEFFDFGASLGTVSIRNGKATLRLDAPRLGQHQFSVRYSGDVHFAAHSYLAYFEPTVVPGPTRIRVERIPGTYDLLVTITGVDGYPPTGTVAIEDADNPLTTRQSGPLTPVDSARSTYTARGLAGAKTVYVDYRGDHHYRWETIYIDFNRSTKGRSVRH